VRRAVPIAVAAAAVAAVVAFGLRHQQQAGSQTALPDGFKRYAAPALTGRTLAGAPFSLARYRGRPVVINFWATYCAPCKTEAPELARAAQRLGSRVRFVGVDVSDHDGKARRFARAHGWRYPIVADPNGDASSAFAVSGIPTTFIVDANGVVVDRIQAGVTAKQLEAKLAGLS
jgi:thiol-disulfide isomerase/thioredoxin